MSMPTCSLMKYGIRFKQNRQALQRFIGQTDWNHQQLFQLLSQQVVTEIGEVDGILVFDPNGFEKDDKKSAGVARKRLPFSGESYGEYYR